MKEDQLDVILKVNNARLSTLEAVKHEYEVAKAVEGLGLLTPMMHEMARVLCEQGKILFSTPCNTDFFPSRKEQLHLFWDAFAKEYTGREDHSEFDALAGKFAALDVIVRTHFVQPTWVEKLFFGVQLRRLFDKKGEL